MLQRGLLALAALVVAAVLPGSAGAGSNLFFGFTEDAPKWEGTTATSPAQALGAKAFRITLTWPNGATALTAGDISQLDLAVGSSLGLRIVPAVSGLASYAPQDAAARDAYCSYVRSLLARYPTINDVVIWGEPNKSAFWRPQFNADGTSAAPAAYQALAARCYDVLHAERPAVNVIAPATSPRGNDNPLATSNISHSPGNFIRKMGEAYRASGRQAPLFDILGHHVYGNTSAERPWKQHTNTNM